MNLSWIDSMKHEIKPLSASELRKFGFIMAAVIGVLFGLLLPWLFGANLPLWPWYIAAGFVVPAIIVPNVLGPVYKLWMRFGLVLGWINTRIILGILFYIMFTPVSLFFMIVRRDAMRRKYDNALQSYRVESHSRGKEQMEKPY